MAYIDYIAYDDGSSEMQKMYEKHGGRDKCPANIIRISGINPKVLDQHVQLYRSIMFGKSPLSRHRREMIAVMVSILNHCHY